MPAGQAVSLPAPMAAVLLSQPPRPSRQSGWPRSCPPRHAPGTGEGSQSSRNRERRTLCGLQTGGRPSERRRLPDRLPLRSPPPILLVLSASHKFGVLSLLTIGTGSKPCTAWSSSMCPDTRQGSKPAQTSLGFINPNQSWLRRTLTHCTG